MTDSLISAARAKMEKAIAHLSDELAGLRSGRASTALVDGLKVNVYGQAMPLKSIASLSTPDAKTIAIQPWDRSNASAIEKAISEDQNLGLTPNNDGNVIRLNLPPLSTERREQLKKMVAERAESARVSMRNARHEAMNDAKTQAKAKSITEDDVRDVTEQLNKLIDSFSKQIDEHVAAKNNELMEV